MTSMQSKVEIQDNKAIVFRGSMAPEAGLQVRSIQGTDLKVAWSTGANTRDFLPGMLSQWERDVPEHGMVTTAPLYRPERHAVHKWAAEHGFAHRTLRCAETTEDKYSMRLTAM